MDLNRIGKLLRELRIAKGMTQKEIAEKLDIVPKTVSKWETGHGFPDVSVLSSLADLLGVSERMLLTGNDKKNPEESGNMIKTNFYVCPHCMSIIQSTGNGKICCCEKQLNALTPKVVDNNHSIKISEVDDDFYVEISHDMTKSHYIVFVSYVKFDRILTIRLYPEQDCAVRIPRMYGGKFMFYCNEHGLFEYKI